LKRIMRHLNYEMLSPSSLGESLRVVELAL
jgi:hypothetical protein